MNYKIIFHKSFEHLKEGASCKICGIIFLNVRVQTSVSAPKDMSVSLPCIRCVLFTYLLTIFAFVLVICRKDLRYRPSVTSHLLARMRLRNSLKSGHGTFFDCKSSSLESTDEDLRSKQVPLPLLVIFYRA